MRQCLQGCDTSNQKQINTGLGHIYGGNGFWVNILGCVSSSGPVVSKDLHLIHRLPIPSTVSFLACTIPPAVCFFCCSRCQQHHSPVSPLWYLWCVNLTTCQSKLWDSYKYSDESYISTASMNRKPEEHQRTLCTAMDCPLEFQKCHGLTFLFPNYLKVIDTVIVIALHNLCRWQSFPVIPFSSRYFYSSIIFNVIITTSETYNS